MSLEQREHAQASLSVQQRALLKARTVQSATGGGAIATATAAYVDAEEAGSGVRPASEVLLDIEMDERLDELVERLRPQSRSNERAVIYQAAACFVGADGEEVHGYAQLSMPIEFAHSTHATIPISAALDKLFVRVSEARDLKFVGSDAFDDFYTMQQEG